MWNGWVERVLEGYGGVEWVGLARSWKVIEEENGFEFGLEGFLRVVEPRNGLGLGWRGP